MNTRQSFVAVLSVLIYCIWICASSVNIVNHFACACARFHVVLTLISLSYLNEWWLMFLLLNDYHSFLIFHLKFYCKIWNLFYFEFNAFGLLSFLEQFFLQKCHLKLSFIYKLRAMSWTKSRSLNYFWNCCFIKCNLMRFEEFILWNKPLAIN